MIENEVVSVARGRVNLIGEHTDYNGGYVLPTLIPQSTRVELRKRKDNWVCATSHGFSNVEYELGHERAIQKWSDYLQGVTSILAQEGFRLSGFDAAIDSSVPMGSGLSSSAALEVSLLKGLNELFELGLNPLQIALLGQKAENDFVGARVGIMDQMVCSLGQLGEALFIDTRSLETKSYPLPLDKIELVVIDSGVHHNLTMGDYNQRRAECEWACRLLDVAQLRDIQLDDIDRFKMLPDVLVRRARHVVTENARVLAAVEALKRLDFVALGDLFSTSHISMRDDYEVSVPEIDLLVELAMEQSEVYGARLTGGGFGGSIVALTRPGTSHKVAMEIVEEYRRVEKAEPQILVPRIPMKLQDREIARDVAL